MLRRLPLALAAILVSLVVTQPTWADTAQQARGCANGVCAFPQDETANKDESIDDVDRQFQRMLQADAGKPAQGMMGMGKMGGMNMAAMMQNCPCMKMMGMMMRQQGGGAMPGMDHGSMGMTAPKN